MVPLEVIWKVIGGGTIATNYGRVNAATVISYAGAVTPITVETGMGTITSIEIDTLAPLIVKTGTWVDYSCVV